MIYDKSFIDFLKNKFGKNVKLTSRNIVIPCPWCEYGKVKDHYHMYISTEAPIFHCFHASCEQSGLLRKLLLKIHGTDVSDVFVDKTKIAELKNKRDVLKIDQKERYYTLPEIEPEKFKNKMFYLRKRLKFANVDCQNIKGLILDFYKFIELNNIPIEGSLFHLIEYLQTNFIGFLTEHNSFVACRNINDSHSLRFHKVILEKTPKWLDYYKINGKNPNSNTFVLAEGIFDIFAEQIFDSLNIENDVRLYASALSSRYVALVHSLVYHEQVFRPDIIILSDSDVPREQYEKLLYFNQHIINSLRIYYNKSGKDFNIIPAAPVQNIFRNEETKYGRYKKRKTQRNFRTNGRISTTNRRQFR
jgi:hypothetical protein